jgi:hypothetical protein
MPAKVATAFVVVPLRAKLGANRVRHQEVLCIAHFVLLLIRKSSIPAWSVMDHKFGVADNVWYAMNALPHLKWLNW